MSITKDDVREVFNEGIETLVLPRFDALEGRMDRLEGRMDRLEGRMDAQEKTTADLRTDMRVSFTHVNERIDEVIKRIGSLEEDIRQLYRDVGALKAIPSDKRFHTLNMNDRVLRLHGELLAIAKEAGISLPQ